VAIDELDKLTSIDAARTFMNELKALFGIENCFFLISISEDAMASFETRGLPFRDVFDSSLDEVVTLRPLGFAESRDLLFRRIKDLDLPFVALLHCISGGIPRDLIRQARALVVLSQGAQDGMPLETVCAAVVRRELVEKGEGLIAAIRASGFQEAPSQLLGLAERFRTTEDPTVDALSALRREAADPELVREFESDDTEAVRRLVRIARELDGFLYFLVTVREHFDDALTEERFQLDEKAIDPRARIDHLAHARQAFGTGSGLAVTMIEEWHAARAEAGAHGA